MDYPYTRGEDYPDYYKNAKWNFLHTCIDLNSQISIDEYPGDGVQAITRLQYVYANLTFYTKSRYNILFHQVIKKEGESAINYIKIFQNAKALAISVENGYFEDHFIHNFLGSFQKGRK